MVFCHPQFRARVNATVTAKNLQLAPAAGSGIGKLLFDGLLARPDFIPSLIEAACGGLKACNYFYAKGTGQVEETPDYKTRLQAVVMILANAEGEPIKRVIHQHMGSGGSLDIVGALRESPAVFAALEREMEKARWKGGRKAPKAVQSADTDAPSELPAE